MAVNVGDLITDTDYNNMRTTVESVLGAPVGTHGSPATNLGYGQPLESSTVANGATVTADDLNKLYLDIYACKLHQVGGTGFTVQEVSVGNIIGADASGTSVANLNLTQQGVNDFINESDQIFTDREDKDTGYMQALAANTRSRTTAWGYGGLTTITHIFSVSFGGQTKSADSGNTQVLTAADHYRAFFNTGGEIRWYGSRSGGAAHTKNTDWTNMFADLGTVKMDRDTVTVTGNTTNTTVTSKGGFELSTTYQDIIVRTGANYSVNNLTLAAKVDSNTNPTVVTMRLQLTDTDDDYGGATFDDGYVEPAVDPSVDGTLSSNTQIYLAQDSNNIIEITAPSVNTNVSGTDL
jgi:hypothetical protein